MKYLSEYRDPHLAQALIADIRARVTRPWVLMEICGGQTHTILRYGLDQLLPPEVQLVHGPGCPVCVTPLATIDRAVEIAERPGTVLVSYGDMLRVPGSRTNLFRVRAAGGDVRVAYSPMEALPIARECPDRQVVFLGVGFETTAPANAMTVRKAADEGLSNYSLLSSHVLVPPAIGHLLGDPGNRVQGFIAPGHVCAITGYEEYEQIGAAFRVPMVVGGFEPLDLLEAILRLVVQLEEGRAETENQYVRAVPREGNRPARALLSEVFEVCDRAWRGLGVIPASGLRLRPELRAFDAEHRFPALSLPAEEPSQCLAAEILQGRRLPTDCPAFDAGCTPEHPMGASMVSGEGACAAYHLYRRAHHPRVGP